MWVILVKGLRVDHDASSCRLAVVEQQLDQVAAEIARSEPEVVVINGLLGSLRYFAQSAIASAGAGAGALGLTEVMAHWPF